MNVLNVLMISPGFPAEMPFFTRGLARVGANAIGIGDQAQSVLPEIARESLSAYFQGNCLPLWVDQGDGGVVGSTKD